jgi:hypothetical protein
MSSDQPSSERRAAPHAGRPRGEAWRNLQAEGIEWEGQILIGEEEENALSARLIITSQRLAFARGGEVVLDIERWWLKRPPYLSGSGAVNLRIQTPSGHRERLPFIARDGRLAATDIITILTEGKAALPTAPLDPVFTEVPERPAPRRTVEEPAFEPEPAPPPQEDYTYAADVIDATTLQVLDTTDFPPVTDASAPTTNRDNQPNGGRYSSEPITISTLGNQHHRLGEWTLDPIVTPSSSRRSRAGWAFRLSGLIALIALAAAFGTNRLPDADDLRRPGSLINAPDNTPTSEVAIAIPTTTVPISDGVNAATRSAAETAAALGVGGETETVATATATPIPTATAVLMTPAPTRTNTATATNTATETTEPTVTATDAVIPVEPTDQPEATETPEPAPTDEPTATETLEPTATATVAPTATEFIAAAESPTATIEIPTDTATVEPTATTEPTLAPTDTPTEVVTPEPTEEPVETAEPTLEPTTAPTETATTEPTAPPTATATTEPTFTATAEPSATETAEPTPTPGFPVQNRTVGNDETPDQVFATGAFRYTVEYAVRAAEVPTLDLAASTTGEWVVIVLYAQNWSEEPATLNMADFQLLIYDDSFGYRFAGLDPVTPEIGRFLGFDPVLDTSELTSVPNGEGIRVALVYQVPTATTDIELVDDLSGLNLSRAIATGGDVTNLGGAPVSPDLIEAFVTEVIDGRTIVVEADGFGATIQYLGVTVPTGTQCYAAEATTTNTNIVLGETVYLERQFRNRVTSAGETLARDVWISNSQGGLVLVSAWLASEGAAVPAPANEDTRFAGWIQAAADAAQGNGAGFWAACGGPPVSADGSNTLFSTEPVRLEERFVI